MRPWVLRRLAGEAPYVATITRKFNRELPGGRAAPWDPAGDAHRLRADLAGVGQHLHAAGGGFGQAPGVGRIKVVAGLEGVAVGALDDEQHDRALARLDPGGELPE